MSSFIDTFKQQGGLKLLRTYWDNGVLGYALCQLLLTGKSKKSLELLRLGVQLKVSKKIRKKYLPVLKDFDEKYSEEHVQEKRKIWIYWSTGMEETAPDIVKRCYRSVCENIKDREIVLLSKYNYQKYVTLPDYVIEKYEKGIIAHVHFADFLRTELLSEHGGTWIDSTVFMMNGNIPSYMLDGDLFMFQKLKPGLDGNSIRISSWFITASAKNKIILAQRHLLRTYWKNNNKVIDYFFFHHFMSLIADYYSDDWGKMIQFPNSAPHILLLMLFDDYDEEKWNALVQFCPIQKLSYKFEEERIRKEGTFYNEAIINKNI